MRGAIPPLPQYAFMAWCIVKHRDSFTFYLLPGRNRQLEGLEEENDIKIDNDTK
jgi:hypothetical protein